MKPSHLVYAVGLLLAGGLLGQLVRADAQAAAKPFRECVGARLWHYSGTDVNDGEPLTKTTKVPAGWTPVAGGATQTEPVVILCR
jgi:hypothetical protein